MRETERSTGRCIHPVIACRNAAHWGQEKHERVRPLFLEAYPEPDCIRIYRTPVYAVDRVGSRRVPNDSFQAVRVNEIVRRCVRISAICLISPSLSSCLISPSLTWLWPPPTKTPLLRFS